MSQARVVCAICIRPNLDSQLVLGNRLGIVALKKQGVAPGGIDAALAARPAAHLPEACQCRIEVAQRFLLLLL